MTNPWETEPDSLDWTHKGSACAIRRHPDMKHLCGYVGLPEDHPWYGEEGDVYDLPDFTRELTWSNDRLPGDESGDLWWIGFACADPDDLVPGYQGEELYDKLCRDAVYREIDYVKRETESLAEQLAAVGDRP